MLALASKEQPAISLNNLEVYFKSAFSSSVALKHPLSKISAGSKEVLQIVNQYQGMVREFRDAVQETIRLKHEQQPGQQEG